MPDLVHALTSGMTGKCRHTEGFRVFHYRIIRFHIIFPPSNCSSWILTFYWCSHQHAGSRKGGSPLCPSGQALLPPFTDPFNQEQVIELFSFFFFLKSLYLLLRERERASMSGGGAEREGDRENRKQVPVPSVQSPKRAWPQELWDQGHWTS